MRFPLQRTKSLPTAARSTCLKTCDAKSEIEHNIYERKLCRADKNTKKRQMACQNHKIAGVMQTVNSADGVREAKHGQIMDESANSERPKKRKKGGPSEQSRDRNASIQQNVSYLSWWGGEQVIFLNRKCSKSFFENVLATAARNSFLKKYDAESEIEHHNYERTWCRAEKQEDTADGMSKSQNCRCDADS